MSDSREQQLPCPSKSAESVTRNSRHRSELRPTKPLLNTLTGLHYAIQQRVEQSQNATL